MKTARVAARVMLGVALILPGCASRTTERAPPPADCVGSCGLAPSIGGSGAKVDGSASADVPPLGTLQEAGADASVTVNASIAVTSDETFVATVPEAGEHTIELTAADGVAQRQKSVAGRVLFAAVAGGPAWYAIFDNLPSANIRSTFGQADLVPGGDLKFAAVGEVAFLNVVNLLGVALDATRGHVIVRITRNHVPLAAVRVTSPAKGTVVAYDNGAGYVIEAGGTSTQRAGTILLFNVPAIGYPGAVETFVFDGAAGPFVLDVRVASGFATLASTDRP